MITESQLIAPIVNDRLQVATLSFQWTSGYVTYRIFIKRRPSPADNHQPLKKKSLKIFQSEIQSSKKQFSSEAMGLHFNLKKSLRSTKRENFRLKVLDNKLILESLHQV